MNLEGALKILAVCGGIASFTWTVWTWRADRRADSERTAATRRIEATKPFLDQQLDLYMKASQAAAILATDDDPAELAKAKREFHRLYWGVLAMVENPDVEAAMIAMRKSLEANEPKEKLRRRSLDLAHACRGSLDKSWGIYAWTKPDEASGTPPAPARPDGGGQR